MAKIVIKRRISLDFLGEDYKDDYLLFNAIALRDYEAMLPDLEAAGDDGKKSIAIIKKMLEDHFIEGKFQSEAVEKTDLVDFDLASLTKIFESFTGQSPDPKVPEA